MSEAKERRSNVKNSIVLSGLIGTAGLFVAKLLGLLYSIPLSRILVSEELSGFYGTAYQIYSYVLNICTAGIPFAISTLVAKYTVLNDFKSIMSVKRISTKVMTLMGAAGMIIMMLVSGLAAKVVAGDGNVAVMTTCMRILSMALFFVPILSCYRGFWQGRKEMGEYAISQTFEQIFRVAFLLSMACMIVYVFDMDRKYALYAAVMSTSVAAIAGILQIKFFDSRHIGEIKEGEKAQSTDAVAAKILFKELMILAVPYLLSSIIGYIDSIFNSFLLPEGLRMYGYSTEEYQVIIYAFNYVGYKLTSIPQVLAPGFAAALIPQITEAMTRNDKKKVSSIVVECVGIVLFIGSMASFCIALYATDIYNVLYYTSNVPLASSVIRWLAIEGWLGTICPVTTSLMIAIGFKKDILKRQAISAVLKGILMLPLIKVFGFPGAILSSIVGNSYIFIGNLREIDEAYDIDLKSMFRTIGKIAAALAVMFAVSYGLRMAGIGSGHTRKLIGLLLVCINGMVSLIAYFGASQVLKIPQDLFHKDILSVLKAKLLRRRA